MRRVAILVGLICGCGGAASAQIGGTTVTPASQRRPQDVAYDEACEHVTPDVFVVRFDALTAHFRTSGAPVEGQRVRVCVDHADWRETYHVGTSSTALERATEPAREAVVGAPAPSGAAASSEVGRAATPPASSDSACTTVIDHMISMLDSHREAYIRRLYDAFARPMDEAGWLALRAALTDVVLPSAEEGDDDHCGSGRWPTRLPPATDERCSLQARINYALPNWLWLADGDVLFVAPFYDSQRPSCDSGHALTDAIAAQADAALEGLERRRDAVHRAADFVHGSADASAMPPIPAAISARLPPLTSAIQRTRALAEFSDQLLNSMQEPQRVFDLGTFGADRLVTITLHRERLGLRYEDRRIRTEMRQFPLQQSLEVHGTSVVRLEPGFAFSALRRPTFSIGPGLQGDTVIRVDDEGHRVLHPAVFLSHYWCPMDLRLHPWERVCYSHGHRMRGGFWDVAPHLPTFTIGLPLDDTLARGNLFVGLAINNVPFVTLSVGAHFGFAVTQLRPEYEVGDRFMGSEVATVTRSGVNVAPFLSLTMSQSVFESFRGFRSTQ